MKVRFKKLSDKAVTPLRGTADAAGVDLTATAVSKTEDYIQYNTDIAVEIPHGYVGLLCPRSSICKFDLALANGIGIIDSDYRGELMFRFKETKKDSIFAIDPDTGVETGLFAKKYQVGDRVGQLVIVPYVQAEYVESDSLDETERGEGSYGSTGIGFVQ